MKKIIIYTFLAFATIAGFAQADSTKTLVSKKGIPILPKAGDYGIGVDALPYLQFMGNLLSSAGTNTLNLNSTTIYGKYFLDNNTAVRALLSITDAKTATGTYVRDDAAFAKDPLSRDKTEDWKTTNLNGYRLDVAYIKYRGYGRLRGFYGLQVGLTLDKTRDVYEYGNPITVANPTPSSISAYNGPENSRLLSTEGTTTFTAAVGGLAGIEYYFMPKVCIGFEVNLALAYSITSQTYGKYEKINGTSVESFTALGNSAGANRLSLISNSYPKTNQQTPASGLYVIFHF